MKTSRQEQFAHGAKAHDRAIPHGVLPFDEIAKIISQQTGTKISRQAVTCSHNRAIQKLRALLQSDPLIEQKFLECL